MSIIPTTEAASNLVEIIYVIFLRAVALVFVYFALQYWLRVVGYYDGADFQFDTMSDYWRVAAAVLSVLLPVAALGLWGLFSWGPVVWIFAIGVEVGMYIGMPDSFGKQETLMMFHLACVVLFLVLQVLKRFIVNKT